MKSPTKAYPLKIYNRECYKHMQETINNLYIGADGKLSRDKVNRNFVKVMGTPGVGKTMFGALFLKSLLDRDIPFLYESVTSASESSMCLVTHDGKLVGEQARNSILNLAVRQNVSFLYICDGKEPNMDISRYDGIATILICSPRVEYYRRLHKTLFQQEFCEIYMPLWKLTELTVIQGFRQDKNSPSTLTEKDITDR